ncbi:MAG TPA: cytochrome c [Bryobacteraceae bacterium]|jgi:mono/diheme cytochrome c family protein
MKWTLLLLAFAAQDGTRTTWDGVYTSDQSTRGRALYNRECASCHGQALTGGEMAPPLAGGDFLTNWDGLTAADLLDRMRNTMPLNKPKSLSRQTNADILAYIFNSNRFPAGNDELPIDGEMLKQIRIQAAKPEK